MDKCHAPKFPLFAPISSMFVWRGGKRTTITEAATYIGAKAVVAGGAVAFGMTPVESIAMAIGVTEAVGAYADSNVDFTKAKYNPTRGLAQLQCRLRNVDATKKEKIIVDGRALQIDQRSEPVKAIVKTLDEHGRHDVVVGLEKEAHSKGKNVEFSKSVFEITTPAPPFQPPVGLM